VYPVVPLSVLFRIIYNTCPKQSDLDLTEFPDVTLPKAVLDEFVSMNAVVANLHRQHFGLGSREEYESAGMKMGRPVDPLHVRRPPSHGAQQHCVLHVHNRDVLHMRCRHVA
jgi:hypothetical protein